MDFISVAQELAAQVSEGTYAPTPLDRCEATLAKDRYPQLVRFAQFTLFTSRFHTHFTPPRYLVLQPQRALNPQEAAQQETVHRQSIIEPFLKHWQSELATNRVPDPERSEISQVREAVNELSRERETDQDRRVMTSGLRQLPRTDLPDEQFRVNVQTWISSHIDSEVRRTLRAISAFLRADVGPPARGRPLTVDDLGNTLAELAFPGPYQLLGGMHWPIALCAMFEQTWELQGYTRGELVGSLSLAPGERMTLEVHTWDKSSRKSEEELATEFEMRTAEKSTQRDALTVAQEYAQQADTNMKASGTIPIPNMPIGVDAQTSTKTQDSLRRTTDQLRERTLEASTTLKLNRKTRIEISRESGREEKQTRTLENTNRCHTLNCHYFEVVANYTVRTRLATVQPCVLLRYPRPVFTLDWILCHQDILVRSLIDHTFLPGFEGARLAKVAATIAEMEARERLAQLEILGEQVAPFAAAIDHAYRSLTEARDTADATFQEHGPGNAFTIMNGLGSLGTEHLISYFGLQASAQAALDALSSDLASGRNPASALRTLLMITSPDLPPLQNTEVKRIINDRYQTWGGELGENEVATRIPVEWDLLTYDDAGLRAGVIAAFDFLKRAPLVGETPVQAGQAVDPGLAAAQVEFERLQCHLNEHWLHYAQAVWMREDADNRLLRLQFYGPIVSFIENELLGFYGNLGAFPLRDAAIVDEMDLDALLHQLQEDIDQAIPEPVLITMPTPGVLMEAVTGECDACEDYIHDGRTIDLRIQAARASQEEAEADRRQQRVAQNDLSDPAPSPGALIVELHDGNTPPGDGT